MAKLSPIFNGQIEDGKGAPASGWKIHTYIAGSSTARATYTTSSGDVPQANPIVLNSLGFPDHPIWLAEGSSYKFILTDANDVVKKTIDNVSGVNDASVDVSQWKASGLNPTYVSAISYTVAGDQTTEFHVGRRQQFTATAGTVYGTIASSAYNGSSLTTVTMTMDSGQALDPGLSVVNHSILRADNPALPGDIVRTPGVQAKGKALNYTRVKADETGYEHRTAAQVLSDIGAVALTGNQTVGGTKTFSSPILGSLTGNADTATKLSTASGTAPSFALRAWARFNGVTPGFYNGGNVSTLGDNGVGDWTLNFSTAMPDDNYGVLLSHATSGGVTTQVEAASSAGAPTLQSTSAVRITHRAGTTLTDCANIYVAIVR